jgi:hypothetical protein
MLSHVTDRRRTLVARRAAPLRSRVASPGRLPRTIRRSVAAVVAALIGVGCTPLLAGLGPIADRQVAALGHNGRWFTDPSGRVVMLRGMNFVEKWAPFTPAADGFKNMTPHS